MRNRIYRAALEMSKLGRNDLDALMSVTRHSYGEYRGLKRSRISQWLTDVVAAGELAEVVDLGATTFSWIDWSVVRRIDTRAFWPSWVWAGIVGVIARLPEWLTPAGRQGVYVILGGTKEEEVDWGGSAVVAAAAALERLTDNEEVAVFLEGLLRRDTLSSEDRHIIEMCLDEVNKSERRSDVANG